MAGFYPDVPGPKIQYDRDGSVGFKLSGNKTGSVTAMTGAELIALNREADPSPPSIGAEGTYSYGLIFPQLLDIVGIVVNVPAGTTEVEKSSDTTNGLDGTWTQVAASLANIGVGSPTYRTGITSVSYLGIKALRFSHNFGGDPRAYGVHLYGSITSGEALDRLRLWHPTLDAELGAAALDFGDVPREAIMTKTFRVKNNSSTLTANDVTVSREALTDPSPATLPDLELDNAGSGYATSQDIGDLAPGTISGIITLRLVLDDDSRLGLGRQRVVASAASWS